MSGKRGTDREYLMRRLTGERPDLAEQATAGTISVYKAAVQAGIAPHRFSLSGHDPDVLAKAIRRNLPPDVIAALVERLTPREEP